jgi:SAM-dependent methyltransferase
VGVPAGDFDYDSGGADGYALRRRTDPRIAQHVHAGLGEARTVLNVGAGAGSYEPADRYVVAVEPSAAMRAQRTIPAVDATAERLPFDDDAFEAAMATITIHQWADADAGLRELRRVSRGPVVILTFDGDAMPRFWLNEYVPEMIEGERRRYPSLQRVTETLGGDVAITSVPIPLDCVDGFAEAFYGRPEALLDPAVRRSQSAWAFGPPDAEAAGLARLRDALAGGEWDERYGHLRAQPEYEGSLRLVVAR